MLTRKKDISIRQLKELYFVQRNTHLQLHEMMMQLGLLGIEDNEPLGLAIVSTAFSKLNAFFNLFT